MKILLTGINAKYIHSNPALFMLKAYVGREDFDIEIAEYTINNMPFDILSDIYKKRPDVICISCYIWNIDMVERLIEELPKVLPSTDIWLGGPEVSYDYMSFMKSHELIKGIMVGEGEETFKELSEYYNTNAGALSSIKGICIWKEDTDNGAAEPYYTGARAGIDMNSIPFYYDKLTDFENRIIYYESSRGCPFACSYCLSSIEKNLRFRDTDTVLRELQFFMDKRVPQVKFIDRTFNCNHKHAMAIWKYITEHDNGITNFHFEISADLITEEELDVLSMMRKGLIQLEIGVQSTNPDTIKEIRRTMKLSKLKEIVSRIHNMENIHQHLDLIAGLPYEDLSSFENSFNEVYEMKPDQLQLGFLKVLKGSYMETKVAEYDIKYQSRPPYEVLSTKWLSYGEVLILKQVEEMVEQYYNSGQFTYTLPYLVGKFDSPYSFFYELALYYERMGLYTNKPARLYKYQVILGFAREYESVNVELLKELLTFDMYLREKCKSRPEFARNLADYKKEIYSFELSKKEMVDIYFYPVWEKNTDKLIKSDAPWLVGFDYDNRNPLSNNATIRIKNINE